MTGCDVDSRLVFAGAKTLLDPLSAAAWPIAALTGLYLYRDKIGEALGRVRSIKAPGVEAELAPDVAQSTALRAANEADNSLPEIKAGKPPPHIVYDTEDAMTLATLDQHIGSDPTDRFAWAIRMRSISETNRRHETSFRLMFGSQLKALRLLNQSGRIPVEDLRPIFEEAKQNLATSQFHVDRTFEQWGGFLYQAGYVSAAPAEHPGQVEITPLGVNFLLWLIEWKVIDLRPG